MKKSKKKPSVPVSKTPIIVKSKYILSNDAFYPEFYAVEADIENLRIVKYESKNVDISDIGEWDFQVRIKFGNLRTLRMNSCEMEEIYRFIQVMKKELPSAFGKEDCFGRFEKI